MAEGPITKVFIGHLPRDCTHGDIENILEFAKIGEEAIKKCEIHLVYDRGTDAFKGFAYVELHNAELVDKVLALDQAEFAGQKLRVDKATPKSDDKRGGRGGSRGGFRGGPRGRDDGFRGGPRGGGSRRGSDSGPTPGREAAHWERGQDAGGRGRGGFDGPGRGGQEMRRGGFDGPRGGRGGFDRGGHGHDGPRGGGYRGGFRERRDSHRGGRGGRGGGSNNNERRGSASSEKHEGDIVVNDSADPTERPRLQLTKLNLDPAALEAKKLRDQQEEEARRAKLFEA